MVAFVGCENPSGSSGASKDISDAKKRGVFLAAYHVNPNPYPINDTLQITIEEAWIERKWRHGGKNDETVILSGYQLCVNTTKKDVEKIAYPYNTIGIGSGHYLKESSEDSYTGDLDLIPSDTIQYLVQHGNNLMDDSSLKKQVIGKLILIKNK